MALAACSHSCNFSNSSDGWLWHYVVRVVAAGAAGAAFGAAAYHTAPNGKVIAGTVMVTLLVLLSLLVIAGFWFGRDDTSVAYTMLGTAQGIACCTGAITAQVAKGDFS